MGSGSPNKAPEFFWAERQYFGSRGQRVTERIIKGGQAPADFARYVGHAVVQQQVMTPQGPAAADVQMQFPIPASSVEGACKAFGAAFEKALADENKRREAESRKVIAPGPGDTLRLNGRG